MNKLFTKIAVSLIGMSLAIGVGVAAGSKVASYAEAADSISGYTLVYENTCPENTKNKNYDGGQDETTVGDVGWYTRYINANANSDWRIGGKSISSAVRVVYTKTGFADTISKIRIKWTNTKTLQAVSVTATIHGSAEDATSGSNPLDTFSHSNVYAQDSYKDLDKASGWENCYLRISATCTNSTSSNQCIALKSVAFYKKNAASTYSVTYNGNGNTSGAAPTDSTAYASGATVTVKGNTGSLGKTNCEFLGWNTNKDATSAQYIAGNTFSISENTTLYAIWNQVDFPVTYNKNGGSGSAMTDSNSPYDKNDTVTVLENVYTAPSGKEFVEWNTKADGTGTSYDPGDTFTITETTTLYAQWQYIIDDGTHITWNLKTNSFASSCDDEVVWQGNTKISFTLETGESSTNANNYLGGVDNHNLTKFYNKQVLTFSVINEDIKISSIAVTASTSGYATNLQSSTWTNATATIDGTDDTIVNITPSSGKGTYGNNVSAVFGSNASNYHQIQITYEYLPVISVSPSSIVVEANDENTTTLSYEHFTGSGVPTITASVTSGTALTAGAVTQSGTTITVAAGSNTGTVVFTLTGTISAQSATTTLTVEVVEEIIPADYIAVEEGQNVITYKGTDKALTITVLGEGDEEASNQNVTCTSSNTSILTVTDAGVITPKAKGKATVTIVDQDELCTPVVVNVRVREKTLGDYKQIGVLDLSGYSSGSDVSGLYTTKNGYAAPTSAALSGSYYDEGTDGVRIGKSSGSGTITITFASVKVKKVEIKAKLWDGDTGALTVTGATTSDSYGTSSYSVGTYTLSTAGSTIEISAAGKPRYYVAEVKLYSDKIDISNETDTQACYTFEETYMHLDDYNSELGYCKDKEHNYYQKDATKDGAKKGFNSLTSDQRTLFTTNATFADAWARLQAWATANGDSLNGSNQLATTHITPVVNIVVNETSMVAVVAISVLVLTTLGGYFFFHKKEVDIND